MIRSILAVIAGIVVMSLIVMALFIGGAFALGTERVLVEGEYRASVLWNICSALIGILGAVSAGAVCQLIARNGKAAIALAVFAFIGGIPPLLRGPDPPPQPRTETGFEAIMKTSHPDYRHEPMLTRILNLLIGTGGVLAGAALVRRRSS